MRPGRVSHLLFGFEFGKFPLKNVKIFNFFPLIKKKISSGWVKKYLGRRQGELLFTERQK